VNNFGIQNFDKEKDLAGKKGEFFDFVQSFFQEIITSQYVQGEDEMKKIILTEILIKKMSQFLVNLEDQASQIMIFMIDFINNPNFLLPCLNNFSQIIQSLPKNSPTSIQITDLIHNSIK
jgi:hypothetical protein